ncbi:MAG: class I SAM-dependent methyltransferase [Myxococcota bacterium]
MDEHAIEVTAGERFEFGANWDRFLKTLDEARITEAERSLREMLECKDLRGRSFLDVGCGSGLFSLAARRMGATVHSFDFDPRSVACARELRERFHPDDPAWSVAPGSVLDREYLAKLGAYDVVYSWGVLHHTGAMWQALENVVPLVAHRGQLFIAIYNDQGRVSRQWRWVKRTYNRLPRPLRFLVVVPSALALWWRSIVKDLVTLRPFASFRGYGRQRGMALGSDLIDWVGGYPFEVATPGAIFDFFRARGFSLSRLVTTQDHGCNQFVFVRGAAGARSQDPLAPSCPSSSP